MTSLDFTDMFKKGSHQESSLEPTPYTEPNRELVTEDSEAWVIKQLNDMNIYFESDDWNERSLKILATLLSEVSRHFFECPNIRQRQHWQQQSMLSGENTSKMNSKMELLNREKDFLTAQVATLNQDVTTANNRISRLQKEHREVKGQWLAEKSDLEGRCFQMQSLSTQVQGTLRKKEKDYDKLQAQLQKIVKDGARAQKPAAISISKPLTRNQTQHAGGNSIVDAELTAAKHTISVLEAENSNLREAIADLTQNFEEFQSKMTSIILEREREQQAKKEMTCLERAREVEERLERTSARMQEASAALGAKTPLTPRRAARIPGTPTARPAAYLVHQAVNDVASLRQKMQSLGLTCDTSDECIDKENMENCTPIKTPPRSTKNSSEVTDLTRQLQEALAVIREQDQLIHAALIGKLPYDNNRPIESDGEFEYDDEPVMNDICYSPKPLATPRQKGTADFGWKTTSPETMKVLEEAGFTSLPAYVTSDITSQQAQEELKPVTLTLDED